MTVEAINTAAVKRMVASLQDFKKVFETDEGERVLWNLMKQGNMQSTTIVKVRGTIDIHQTLVREGERNLILYILDKLKYKQRDIINFIERQEREQEHDQFNFG